MLKIKDDIDLKELEKFGFMEYLSCDDGKKYYCIYDIFIGEDKFIKQDDGLNYCRDKFEHKFNDDEIGLIYDLITAGLVEKVEEER